MKNPTVAFLLSLGLIFSTWLFTHSWDKRLTTSKTINVTGLAHVDFTSDLIVWRGSFSKKAISIKDAYAQLKKDEELIKSYLLSSGITEGEMVISSVDIDEQYEYRYDANGKSNRVFTGYNLRQEVKIESKEVEKVERISRKVTELLDQGVQFYSHPPQYFYSGLSDLKVDLIAAATADARARAEQIAEKAQAGVGQLVSADLGVFQITGQNSNEEYTWGGVYNTQVKNKTARVTARLKFEID